MTDDDAGKLKAQWIAAPNNVPRVIDPGIDSVDQVDVNPQGAQMLEARDYQNGDAARMFGIPGSLLEYGTPGSSLTYQNVEQVYTQFVRTCLQIHYLVPIEQALTDLLPRSQVAHFYVEGLLRADIKTRFDVYSSGITSGVLDVATAQKWEGIAAGSVEVAPVPPTMPSAVPGSIPQFRTASEPFRCDGTRTRRRYGVTRLEACGKLLSETGAYIGTCPRCRKVYPEVA